jgi:outer membrane protein assembly factor BamB
MSTVSRGAVAALLLAALPLRPGGSQGPAEQPDRVALPGEARDLLSRLAAADRLAARKAWTEALDEYQRLLDEHGDDLVPEHGPRDRLCSTRRSVQLRRLCHLRLAALPPATLALYSDRVDRAAQRWLQQGIEGRDTTALRRVVDEAFLSSAAAQALDRLGDLAFERGDFAAARRWWLLLAPGVLEPPDPDRLVCPGPGDTARTRAKQILALHFEGDLPRAHAELQAFRRLHGAAAGRLAGRKGNYAATLQAQFELRKDGPLAPEEEHWPTFAGALSRNRALTAELSERLWADGPAWCVRLNGDADAAAQPAARPLPGPTRRPAVYPVIADGQVLFADARRVTALDVRSGKRLFGYDLHADRKDRGDGSDLEPPAPSDLPCTLTVDGGHVYSRLGASSLSPSVKERKAADAAPSCLVCLERFAGEGKPAGRVRWLVKAAGRDGEWAAFAGAPLVHDGRVHVAQTFVSAGRTRTAIACLDADSGALRWRRDVCETTDEEPVAPRHCLLTLAGEAVVCCSHTGAVVAVDGVTGKRLWGVRYPGRGKAASSGDTPREPAPCVAVDRRLIVAPRDSDRVLCLDADTGRTLWEREGLEVVQVLGVSAGRLFLTTPGGVRALAAADGSDSGGWRQPAVGSLRGHGRGFLAGGWVLWPTQDERLPVRALNQDDGTQERGGRILDPTRLRRLAPGNMALGNGCLVIAGTDELVGYVPPAAVK